MRDDLIFHLTTEDNLQGHKTGNTYHPESLDTKGFILCSKGSQVEETANRLFPEADRVLLLVIDISTLSAEVKYETSDQTGEKFPKIYGPLNMDAIMDKITIFTEENGEFKIDFSSRT